MQCPKHPTEETFVRCGKCDTPVCHKCSVPGPAGIRCRDCSQLRSSPDYQVDPKRAALAAVAGIVGGFLGGYIAGKFESGGIFAQFWIGALAGFGLGEAIRRITGIRRGKLTGWLAAFSVAAGCGLGMWLQAKSISPSALEVFFGRGQPDWPNRLFTLSFMSAMAFFRARTLY